MELYTSEYSCGGVFTEPESADKIAEEADVFFQHVKVGYTILIHPSHLLGNIISDYLNYETRVNDIPLLTQ